MMAALKYFSDNLNIGQFSIGIYWLSFFFQFEIFLVFARIKAFLVKTGHSGYYEDLLFKPSDFPLADECEDADK